MDKVNVVDIQRNYIHNLLHADNTRISEEDKATTLREAKPIGVEEKYSSTKTELSNLFSVIRSTEDILHTELEKVGLMHLVNEDFSLEMRALNSNPPIVELRLKVNLGQQVNKFQESVEKLVKYRVDLEAKTNRLAKKRSAMTTLFFSVLTVIILVSMFKNELYQWLVSNYATNREILILGLAFVGIFLFLLLTRLFDFEE
jgi:hypothetical protein